MIIAAIAVAVFASSPPPTRAERYPAVAGAAVVDGVDFHVGLPTGFQRVDKRDAFLLKSDGGAAVIVMRKPAVGASQAGCLHAFDLVTAGAPVKSHDVEAFDGDGEGGCVFHTVYDEKDGPMFEHFVILNEGPIAYAIACAAKTAAAANEACRLAVGGFAVAQPTSATAGGITVAVPDGFTFAPEGAAPSTSAADLIKHEAPFLFLVARTESASSSTLPRYRELTVSPPNAASLQLTADAPPAVGCAGFSADDRKTCDAFTRSVMAAPTTRTDANKTYFAALAVRIRNHMTISSAITDAEASRLKATLFVKIGANGELIEAKIGRSSGSAVFDNDVVTAVKRSAPLPPPPPAVRRLVADGVGFNFCPIRCS